MLPLLLSEGDPIEGCFPLFLSDKFEFWFIPSLLLSDDSVIAVTKLFLLRDIVIRKVILLSNFLA
jgi:hypothetical protein